MTIGSWNHGNGVPAGNAVSLVWTRTWSGTDSIIKITEPHPIHDPHGVFRSSQKSYLRPTESTTGKAPVDVFHVVAEAVKLREEMALGDPQPRRLPYDPGWKDSKRKPKRARLAENAYSLDEMFRLDVGYTAKSYGGPGPPSPYVPGNLSTYTGAVMRDFGATTWTAATLLDANDQIKLVNRLREKMQGTDFNTSVFLGEGHQALNMIATAATRIASGLGHLKKGRVSEALSALVKTPTTPKSVDFSSLPGAKVVSAQVKSAQRQAVRENEAVWLATLTRKERSRLSKADFARKRAEYLKGLDLSAYTPKQFASWWLEISYGWLPLLSDAEEGAQFLAHQLNVPLQTTFRTSVRKESRLTRITNWQAYGGLYTATGKSTRTHRRSLIAKIREKDNIPKLLGLTSLESVAWELTPWSFVVDWFIPIGDWLTARGHAQGLIGTFITSDKRTGIAHTPEGNFSLNQYTWTSPSYKRVLFDRTISYVLKVPMPTMKPLAKAASWRHCANAVALLVSGHGGSGIK
jgi:hypothetical protein